MWNHAPARLLRPLPGVLFALAPQEAPEVAAAPLISPDHLIEPFVAEGDPVRGPHPETALLRTPTFRPQLADESPTDTTRQFAWTVLYLLMASLRCALRLLKSVAPRVSILSQFPADRPLTDPQSLADLGLGLAHLTQGIQLTVIFVGEPTICPHG